MGPTGPEPLCAVYRHNFAAVAEEALRAGKYKIDALFPDARVQVVEEEELARAGFGERMFWNVNTREQLLAAESDSPAS